MTASESSTRSARPYGKRLALTYGALAATLVGSVVVVEHWPDSAVVQRYGPNVAAELGGILITLVVVERLLVWQRERAVSPARTVALKQMWYQLNGLLHMLLFAYKATAPPGSPQPIAPEAILKAWKEHARYLDFRRPYGPDGPPRSWHQFAAETAARDRERRPRAD